MTGARTVCGTITLVQERRFQLADLDGVSHLFLLAYDAPPDEYSLQRHAATGEAVRVTYRDAPSLIAKIAERIDVDSKE